jgi:multidrug efflux pump subunit AcrB
VTTILVFLPLAFIGGVDGKFIRLIPLTAVVALVLSYLVSLILAVPLSGLLLKRRDKALWVDRIAAATEKSLRAWLLRYVVTGRLRAALMTAGTVSLFGLALLAADALPNLLYPKEDGRNLGITVELPVDTPLEKTALVGKAVGEVLRTQPYLESITRTVGEKDPYAQSAISDLIVEGSGAHYVGFACRLTPRSERDRLGYQYVEPLRLEIKKVLAAYPGAQVFITPEIGGASAEDPIQIEITGPSIERLRAIAMAVKHRLAQISGVTDVRDDLGQPITTAALIPRREALDFYGISETELASQMRAYMENDKVGKLRHSEVDLDIRLGTGWPSRHGEPGGPRDWEELQGLNIITAEAESIPLSSLVTRHLGQIPQTIPHKEGARTVTIKAKLATGTVNEVLAVLEPQLQAMEWPQGYNYHFAGEKEAAAETYQSTGQVVLIAVLLVYASLVLLFNAFLQPVLIMFSVMFGLTGVFLGFYLLGLPLSFTALVGIVTLVGINVNDVIVMIDTMNRHRREGRPVREAAVHGATDRLRPILSTTLTTTAGLIPLALSDPAWMPLCAAVISGELVSTLMSVVFMPGIYLLVTRDSASV